MYLDKMDVLDVCQDVTTDSGKLYASNVSNLLYVIDEARESGDGDSGEETKDFQDDIITDQGYQDELANPESIHQPDKKAKGKHSPLSKIPIRLSMNKLDGSKIFKSADEDSSAQASDVENNNFRLQQNNKISDINCYSDNALNEMLCSPKIAFCDEEMLECPLTPTNGNTPENKSSKCIDSLKNPPETVELTCHNSDASVNKKPDHMKPLDNPLFDGLNTKQRENNLIKTSKDDLIYMDEDESGVSSSELIENTLISTLEDKSYIPNDFEQVNDPPSISGLLSLSPRAPLAVHELEEAILEAPEEFRGCSATSQVDDGPPEGLGCVKLQERNHHNKGTEECTGTGDTSDRASDKDKSWRGSEKLSNNNMLHHTDYHCYKVAEVNSEGNVESDGDHVQQSCVAQWHVGLYAATPDCETLTKNSQVNTIVGLNSMEMGPKSSDAINTICNEPTKVIKDLINGKCLNLDNKIIPLGDVQLGTNKTVNMRKNSTNIIESVKIEKCSVPKERECIKEEGKGAQSGIDQGSPKSGSCVNSAEESVIGNEREPGSANDACMCAGVLESPPSSPTAQPSIDDVVPRCAPAPGCSRVLTATVCAALDLEQPESLHSETTIKDSKENTDLIKEITVQDDKSYPDQAANLSWTFKNGRLVFQAVTDSESDSSDSSQHKQVVENKNDINKTNLKNDNTCASEVLSSRELNKRIYESQSRLKYLEQKLKEAGITDQNETKINNESNPAINQVCPAENTQNIDEVVNFSDDKHIYDNNQNILNNDLQALSEDELQEIIPTNDDFPNGSSEFCQFDVNNVGDFSEFNSFCEVYDELEDSEDDSECYIIKSINPKPVSSMGTDGERVVKHNPDSENLKSLLKRPGRNRDKKSNRVVFNENKNEFFDADYIILIREECDYDEDEDEGVCTCNQHEMVRLTCCEPDCNCSAYEGFEQTPQSPKYAPPIEFVDAVTLSPPEGYKDMELGEQQLLALQQMARRNQQIQQRAAVCRECSATHDDEEGEGSLSGDDQGEHSDHEDIKEKKEKTDQSQQTTPTTPPIDEIDGPNSKSFHLDPASTKMPVKDQQQRIQREVEHEDDCRQASPSLPPGGSPISGILKGGRLWKQTSLDSSIPKPNELQQMTDSSLTSDEEGGSRRSVRFIESAASHNDKREGNCDGAPDTTPDDENNKPPLNSVEQTKQSVGGGEHIITADSTEMMLTFKLGNHVLISNNSLKPNSAVRQLFPCTTQPTNDDVHQYLVTAESLKAFEEAKKAKLPQIIQSGETDDSIKRAIERNTLRRSLIRYEPRSKKTTQKTDNSLVERIKQLTCDVDTETGNHGEIPPRVSPPGEEARNSPEVANTIRTHDKSFSPSSSSTASSNSSSMSSTYRKITDLFGKREKTGDGQCNPAPPPVPSNSLPDLTGHHDPEAHKHHHSTDTARKQFLSSTLAPLSACVGSFGAQDEFYYHMSHNHNVGERSSTASSVGTEYSLEDIDEVLKNCEEDSKKIAPDVLAGTPSASESGDELAMFVQQDAGRIERLKKKYQTDTKDEDDEHDDYGFNKRPSVRGIKPRFGTTNEIIQQIQNQMQPPPQAGKIAWPYYSENIDNGKRNINMSSGSYQYNVDPNQARTGGAPQYRPTSLPNEGLYQTVVPNNQPVVYRTNGNNPSAPVVKVGGSCNQYYQSLPRQKNGRPQSPPPMDMSKAYHQTMVYIPYNHIEGYQPPYYQSEYARMISNQNQINNRYVEPIYQQRVEYTSGGMVPPPKPMMRMPFPNNRSESPVSASSQYATSARSTQTPSAVAPNYYSQPRYRPMIGPVYQGDPAYVNKQNRHSFPSTGCPRYSLPSSDSTDTDSQHSGQIPNGHYRQSVEITFSQKDLMPNSPSKSRLIERGVPEGAASVSPQDGVQSSSSTMTSPTSPQNPIHMVAQPPQQQQQQKPMFYAMNV